MPVFLSSSSRILNGRLNGASARRYGTRKYRRMLSAKRTISRYQIVHAIVPLALVRTGAIPPGGDWGYHGRFEAAELATCAA